MIEFMFYILSKIFPSIEPYDINRKQINLFVEELNIAVLFDNDTSKYNKIDNVYLIHEKDEPPDVAYMNYYVDEISFEEAARVLKDIGVICNNVKIKEVDHITAKRYYHQIKATCDEKYRKAIIEYMTQSDETIYPTENSNGLNLKNWLEMQPEGYEIEYKYNGYECIVLNISSLRESWGYYYTVTRKYIAVYNTTRIKYTAEIAGVKIAPWIIEQRTAYREGYIVPQRLELLLKVGISFDVFNDSWEEKYEMLKEYRSEHGNICLEKRQEYKGQKLGEWCQVQRREREKKRKAMTQERIEKLDELGFDWHPLESEWNRRYEQYKRYTADNNGNTYISRRTDYEGEHLGAWVETQKKQYTQGKMSKDRVEKMSLINSEFSN